jgi:hypothetical protein
VAHEKGRCGWGNDADIGKEARFSRKLEEELEQLNAYSSSLPVSNGGLNIVSPPASSSSGGHLNASATE